LLYRGQNASYYGDVRALAQLLNEMRGSGVIANYALFGAAAQMRYTEPVATLDADVLVAVAQPDRHGMSESWRKFERRFLDE